MFVMGFLFVCFNLFLLAFDVNGRILLLIFFRLAGSFVWFCENLTNFKDC